MNLFSNIDKLKAFIAPKMTYLVALLDNKIKFAVYTGGNIRGICRYIEIIGAPTKLNTSGQISRHFCPLYSIKKLYRNSPASYFRSMHETEEYL